MILGSEVKAYLDGKGRADQRDESPAVMTAGDGMGYLVFLAFLSTFSGSVSAS